MIDPDVLRKALTSGWSPHQYGAKAPKGTTKVVNSAAFNVICAAAHEYLRSLEQVDETGLSEDPASWLAVFGLVSEDDFPSLSR